MEGQLNPQTKADLDDLRRLITDAGARKAWFVYLMLIRHYEKIIKGVKIDKA